MGDIHAKSFADDAVAKWKALPEGDRRAIEIGGALAAAGFFITIIARSAIPFAVGAAAGAGMLLTRVFLVPEKTDAPVSNYQNNPLRAAVNRRPKSAWEVGAPMDDDPKERTENVHTFNGLVGRAESTEFPVRHRVPESAFYLDPMDDRIRSHVTGPLGPYRNGQSVNGIW